LVNCATSFNLYNRLSFPLKAIDNKGVMSSPSVVLGASPASAVVVPTEKGLRVAGYLIDVIPAIFLGLVGLIPIVGPIMAGLLLTPYWLFRDAFGASPGKLLLGMRIVRVNGQPASAATRVLRNLPLIAGPLCLLIPVLGYFLVVPVAGTVVLIEGILVLTQGSRLGDRLAGTVVVKR
jgi:uncharacterized RDD family membrane protein YckC